jgi:hypothetical protein
MGKLGKLSVRDDLPNFAINIPRYEWQSFRTRQNRALELTTSPHVYKQAGRYTVPVKVIDIFGNDTMTLLPVTVG